MLEERMKVDSDQAGMHPVCSQQACLGLVRVYWCSAASGYGVLSPPTVTASHPPGGCRASFRTRQRCDARNCTCDSLPLRDVTDSAEEATVHGQINAVDSHVAAVAAALEALHEMLDTADCRSQ